MFRSLLMAGGVGIYGYAPGAAAFFDGINNAGTGTLDTSATTWKDLTGNGYDAIKNETDGPVWGPNGGLRGDSNTSRRLAIQASPLGGAKSFTIELACNFSSTSQTSWWLSSRRPWTASTARGFQFSTFNETKINMSWLRGGSVFLNVLSVQSAYNFRSFAYLYDGASAKLYTDGVLAAQTDDEFVAVDDESLARSPWYINGAATSGLSMNRSDMRIFGVRIYRRILTLKELQKNASIDAERFMI